MNQKDYEQHLVFDIQSLWIKTANLLELEETMLKFSKIAKLWGAKSDQKILVVRNKDTVRLQLLN